MEHHKNNTIAIIPKYLDRVNIASVHKTKDMLLSKLSNQHTFNVSASEFNVSVTKLIVGALISFIQNDILNVQTCLSLEHLELDAHQRVYRRLHSNFAGRVKEVGKIMSYLNNVIKKPPMVVYGGTGYGKSASIAHCVQNLQATLGNKLVFISTYINLTDKSRTTGDIVRHVLAQLANNLTSVEKAISLISTDVNGHKWTDKVLHAVDAVARKKHKRVVILLDNVDQIDDIDSFLEWIPVVLPESVFLILCMDSSNNSVLDKILAKGPPVESLLRVDNLAEEEAVDICQVHCSRNNMKLGREQIGMIAEAFYHCRQVAFLKLILDQSICWCSYDNVVKLRIGRTLRLAIQLMLDDLEETVGSDLLSTTLSLFACSK